LKPLDLSKLTDAQIKVVMGRYEARGLTSETQYAALLEETVIRSERTLSVEKTIAAIRAVAQADRFESYGGIAAASGLKFSFKVKNQIQDHLEDVSRVARQRNWPMITSRIVNKDNIESGDMDETTRKGFADCAKRLGWPVVDEVEFLKSEQKATMEWARRT
jgi:5-methylcytosine-specific restriction protein B